MMQSVGFAVGDVAAAVHLEDGRGDPLFELVDPETVLVLLRLYVHKASFGE